MVKSAKIQQSKSNHTYTDTARANDEKILRKKLTRKREFRKLKKKFSKSMVNRSILFTVITHELCRTQILSKKYFTGEFFCEMPFSTNILLIFDFVFFEMSYHRASLKNS